MAAPFSYIGAVIAVSVSTPATIDSAGFGALTYTTVGKIVSWSPMGDTSTDIPLPYLSGRTEHLNGARDGGEIAWSLVFDTDAGQTLLINNSNNNTTVSFKITDPDTKLAYAYGLVANVQDMERTNNTFKGLTGVFRVNSATIRV